jgi:hypothetical protein
MKPRTSGLLEEETVCTPRPAGRFTAKEATR